MATDLFGETRVHIPDNPTLERECNHILELVARQPELLNGTKMGEIDRKLLLAVWRDNGVREIIQRADWLLFEAWAMNPKLCVDPEIVGRARRWLAEKDYIRLPQAAVQNAEQQRQRIGRSLR